MQPSAYSYPVKRIESMYPPEELRTAGPGRRLAGNLIDTLAPAIAAVVLVVLLISVAVAGDDPSTSETETSAGAVAFALLAGFAALIGWIVWWCICAANGQSPAKQMLNMYVMKEDGTRAGFGTMVLRELVVKGLLGAVLNFFTFSIYSLLASLWCTWDRDHQCLWDKIGSTYVAWSPNGIKPRTASEHWRGGMPPPAFQPQPDPGNGW